MTMKIYNNHFDLWYKQNKHLLRIQRALYEVNNEVKVRLRDFSLAYYATTLHLN